MEKSGVCTNNVAQLVYSVWRGPKNNYHAFWMSFFGPSIKTCFVMQALKPREHWSNGNRPGEQLHARLTRVLIGETQAENDSAAQTNEADLPVCLVRFRVAACILPQIHNSTRIPEESFLTVCCCCCCQGHGTPLIRHIGKLRQFRGERLLVTSLHCAVRDRSVICVECLTPLYSREHGAQNVKSSTSISRFEASTEKLRAFFRYEDSKSM